MGKNEFVSWIPFRKKTIKILIDYNTSTKKVRDISIALNDIFSKTVLDNILSSGVIKDGRIQGKYLYASMENVKKDIFADKLLNVGLNDDQKRNGIRMMEILSARALDKANFEILYRHEEVEPEINDDMTVSWENICKVFNREPLGLYHSVLEAKKTMPKDDFEQNFIKVGVGKNENNAWYGKYRVTQYGLNLLVSKFKLYNASEKIQEYNKIFHDKQQAIIQENSKLKSINEDSRIHFSEKIAKLSAMSGKKIIEVMKDLEEITGVKIHKIDSVPQEIFNIVNKEVEKRLNNFEYWETIKPM